MFNVHVNLPPSIEAVLTSHGLLYQHPHLVKYVRLVVNSLIYVLNRKDLLTQDMKPSDAKDNVIKTFTTIITILQ